MDTIKIIDTLKIIDTVVQITRSGSESYINFMALVINAGIAVLSIAIVVLSIIVGTKWFRDKETRDMVISFKDDFRKDIEELKKTNTRQMESSHINIENQFDSKIKMQNEEIEKVKTDYVMKINDVGAIAEKKETEIYNFIDNEDKKMKIYLSERKTLVDNKLNSYEIRIKNMEHIIQLVDSPNLKSNAKFMLDHHSWLLIKGFEYGRIDYIDTSLDQINDFTEKIKDNIRELNKAYQPLRRIERSLSDNKNLTMDGFAAALNPATMEKIPPLQRKIESLLEKLI